MASQLDIVSQIKSYWNQKATGALFLKLTNDRLLQLFFVKGELQSIKYHGASGMDVLKQVPGFMAVKSQFHEGAISRIVNELPSTAEIINMINDRSFSGDQAASQVNAQVQSVVETIFTEYVGPIADLIFHEEAQQADSVDDLIKRLSKQMDSLDDQVRFKQDVEAALKAH
jgi:PII-like signaling protein